MKEETAYKYLSELDHHFGQRTVKEKMIRLAIRYAAEQVNPNKNRLHLSCPKRGRLVNLCRSEGTQHVEDFTHRVDSIPNTAEALSFIVQITQGVAQPCKRCLKRITKDPNLVEDAKELLKEEVFGLFWLATQSA